MRIGRIDIHLYRVTTKMATRLYRNIWDEDADPGLVIEETRKEEEVFRKGEKFGPSNLYPKMIAYINETEVRNTDPMAVEVLEGDPDANENAANC